MSYTIVNRRSRDFEAGTTKLGVLFVMLASPALAGVASAPTDVFLRASGGARAEMVMDDHGFFVSPGEPQPGMDSKVRMGAFHLDLDATSRADVTGRFRARFGESAANQSLSIDRASVIWKTAGILSFGVGRNAVEAGGFELTREPELRLSTSPYWASSRLAAFKEVADQVSIQFDLADAGMLRVQLLDDFAKPEAVMDASGPPRSYNRFNMQPAAIIAYQGSEGAVVPLIQLGTYDLNHSKFVVGAVKFNLAELSLEVDHTYDMRDVMSDSGSSINHISNTRFTAEYLFRNAMQPFITLGRLAVREDGDPISGNAPPALGGSGPAANEDDVLSDNGREVTAGIWFATPVTDLRPFLSFQYKDGEFLTDRKNLASETERRDQRVGRAGLAYRF